MVQGCDATAGLIGLALRLLQDTQQACADWPTGAVLDQVLWLTPVVRASRRTARVPVRVNGSARVGAGDTVVCDIEAAHRDPAAPGCCASGGAVGPRGLAFGSGLRPCPGRAQALALAAGVVDAVREGCSVPARAAGRVRAVPAADSRPAGGGAALSGRQAPGAAGWPPDASAGPPGPAGLARPGLTSPGVADTVRDWHSLV